MRTQGNQEPIKTQAESPNMNWNVTVPHPPGRLVPAA